MEASRVLSSNITQPDIWERIEGLSNELVSLVEDAEKDPAIKENHRRGNDLREKAWYLVKDIAEEAGFVPANYSPLYEDATYLLEVANQYADPAIKAPQRTRKEVLGVQ